MAELDVVEVRIQICSLLLVPAQFSLEKKAFLQVQGSEALTNVS